MRGLIPKGDGVKFWEDWMETMALERRTLGNGLRVVLCRNDTVHRVCVMVNVGSGCEDERVPGTAHMLEHLMFRGTKRYPSFGRLSEAFERLGADFNAFTSREVTSFDVSLPSESLDGVLSLLGEVMMSPRLSGIASEREIIREEILPDYDGDRLISVDDLLVREFYGEAGHPIAGDPNELDGITRGDVESFFRAHYVASNMVVVLTGAFGPTGDVLGALERAFGGLASVPVCRNRRRMPQEIREAALNARSVRLFVPRVVVQDYDGASQSEVSMGFLFGGAGSGELDALEMLVRVLDDGMASRLSRRLVEEEALVYDVEAFLSLSQGTSLLQVRPSCRPRRVVRLVGSVYGILREIVRDGVSDEELDRVRRRVAWEHEELLDGVSRLAQWLSTMVMQGGVCDVSGRSAELCAVSAESVRDMARRCLEVQPHIVAVVGCPGPRTLDGLRDTVRASLGCELSCGGVS